MNKSQLEIQDKLTAFYKADEDCQNYRKANPDYYNSAEYWRMHSDMKQAKIRVIQCLSEY